jgi:hypothetical protein
MATLQKFKYQTGIYAPDTTEGPLIATILCNSLATGLEVDEITNEEPEADLDTNIPVRVVSRRRSYGLSCRFVTLARLVGTSPNQGRRLVRVPIFLDDNYNAIISCVDPAITYNAITTWTLVSGTEEKAHLAYGPSGS